MDLGKIWLHFKSKPYLYVPLIAIILIFSVLYLWGPFGLLSSEKGAQRLEKNLAEWKSIDKIAAVTARIALVNIVPRLQDIHERTKSTEVPLCLKKAKKQLVQGMERKIKSYVLFMGDSDSLFVMTEDLLGRTNFTSFEVNVFLVRLNCFNRIKAVFESEDTP